MQTTVKILYQGKGEHAVQLPDDVPIQSLAPAIANKLDLPQERLDGTIYIYHFLLDEDLLEDEKTLVELEIEEGTTLELVQERFDPQPEPPPQAPNAAPNARPAPPRPRNRNRQNRRQRRSVLSRVLSCLLVIGLLMVGLCGSIIYFAFQVYDDELIDPVTTHTEPLTDTSVYLSELATEDAQNQAFIVRFDEGESSPSFGYSPMTNEIILTHANEILGIHAETQEIRLIHSTDTSIGELEISENGRYLTAQFNNNTLLWYDLQTNKEHILDNPYYLPARDLEIANDGQLLILGNQERRLIRYAPPGEALSIVVKSFDVELMPDQPFVYGLVQDAEGLVSLQKYLSTSIEMTQNTANPEAELRTLYSSFNSPAYNFCSPFWISYEHALLITSCGEVAFYISDDEAVDMDKAFDLTEVTNIVSFADNADALFFLLEGNLQEVLVWPLIGVQEPYTIPVEGGTASALYTNDSQLIVIGNTNNNEPFLQIRELPR